MLIGLSQPGTTPGKITTKLTGRQEWVGEFPEEKPGYVSRGKGNFGSQPKLSSASQGQQKRMNSLI